MNTICDMPIDWDATGSMLQGLGSIVTIPVLVWAALKGRQAFADYSCQKRSEKHIEAAERVLTAAYNARTAIEGVRSPLIDGVEIAAAERKITGTVATLTNPSPEWFKRAATTQVFYNRLNAASVEMKAVWEVIPTALVYFGDTVHGALRDIANQRAAIQVAAESYLDDNGEDKAFSESIRGTLYRGYRKAAEEDQITRLVEVCVQILEAKLLPLLRAKEADQPV